MNKVTVTIAVLLMVILAACSPSQPVEVEQVQDSAPEQEQEIPCTHPEYKAEATEQMGEFLLLMEKPNVTRIHFANRLKQIRMMECADAFPLKQETLEYAVVHFLEGFDHMRNGDEDAATISANKALLNVERFADWSADMD